MNKRQKTLTIRRPDDWHIHLRDDEILKAVLPYTSKIYNRAIIMPNLVPPITTVKAAISYKERILKAIPLDHKFIPLMTCYLTEFINPNELECGFNEGIFFAAKLYLTGVSTNSSYGVTNINAIMPVLERMEKLDMPLLIHGEVICSDIDIFDREARFIDMVLEPLHQRLPWLKIVFEHITTKEAVDYVLSGSERLAATITPHHLMFNRNHMLANGICPHLYCLPVLKRDIHQKSLREFATSGFSRIFLGTDSAPHPRYNKESKQGCAGCFNAPTALFNYIMVFEEMNALEHFEAFCSINGPLFYGLPVNTDTIMLVNKKYHVPKFISLSKDVIIPFLSDENVSWTIG